MKVEILFFICLSFVGQSLETHNNVVESGSDLDTKIPKWFYALLGRPCLLDEQCIKELSYCDRSKGLSAKISQDLVKIDGRCNLRDWVYPVFIALCWVIIAFFIGAFCIIIRCIIDCVRIWNFEFKKLAIAFSCQKS